jgi:hypothetical protein
VRPHADIKIVSSGPRRRLPDRLKANGARAAFVMLILSATALLLVGPMFVIFVLQTVTRGDGPGHVLAHVPHLVRSNLWLAWPLAVVAISSPYTAGSFIDIRRTHVLFLRKFGNSDATDTVSFAMRRIGRLWMGITLDDSEVAVVGTRARGARGLSMVSEALGETAADLIMPAVHLLRRVLALAFAGVVVAVLVTLVHSGPTWAGSFLRLCLYVLGACAALLVMGFVIVLLGVPLWMTVMALGHNREENPHEQRYSARSPADVIDIRRKIKKGEHSPFGLKLAVVTVDTSFWREAVGGLALITGIPLLDVSRPTEALIWEVAEMLGRFGDRCVFVGEVERLSAEPADEHTARIRELLAGRPVLAYRTGRRGRRAFTRALRATFEARTRLPLPDEQDDPLTEPREQLVQRVNALLEMADLRYRHHLSLPEALGQAREAERILTALAAEDPGTFGAQLRQAVKLRSDLDGRPGAHPSEPSRLRRSLRWIGSVASGQGIPDRPQTSGQREGVEVDAGIVRQGQ